MAITGITKNEMAGKISRDSQNSVQHGYTSSCAPDSIKVAAGLCLLHAAAVSNRFFFLQFAPDIQSEENIRGCEILSGDANGESNVGGKNYRG